MVELNSRAKRKGPKAITKSLRDQEPEFIIRKDHYTLIMAKMTSVFNKDKSKVEEVLVLLDSASQRTYINKELVKKM